MRPKKNTTLFVRCILFSVPVVTLAVSGCGLFPTPGGTTPSAQSGPQGQPGPAATGPAAGPAGGPAAGSGARSGGSAAAGPAAGTGGAAGGAGGAAPSGNLEALADTTRFASYSQDRTELRAIHTRYYRGFAMYVPRSVFRQCKHYRQDKAFMGRMSARYGQHMSAHRQLKGRGAPIEWDYRRAVRALARFEREVAPHASGAEGKMKGHVAQALSLVAQYEKNSTLYKGRHSVFGSISPLRKHVTQTRLYLAILFAMKGGADPAVTAGQTAVKQLVATIAGAKEKIQQAVIANRKPPRNRYRRGDAGRLKRRVKRYWSRKYPDDKVLRVYLPEKYWNRKRGWSYNRWSRRMRYYNVSWLKVQIVTRPRSGNTKVADIWTGYIRKDHLNRGRIDFRDVWRNIRRHSGKMLASRVR